MSPGIFVLIGLVLLVIAGAAIASHSRAGGLGLALFALPVLLLTGRL